MEPPRRRPSTSHVAEVAWGLFLVNLILAGIGALMAPYVGRALSSGLSRRVGVLVSVLPVGVVGVLYLLAIWSERRERSEDGPSRVRPAGVNFRWPIPHAPALPPPRWKSTPESP